MYVNYDKTICYIQAGIPRFECQGCGTVRQTEVPWADTKVSYRKRSMEMAINLMSKMSINATTRR